MESTGPCIFLSYSLYYADSRIIRPPASGRWQVDQPGYTAPISPWLGPAIGRTTEDVPAQAVRPHRRYSLSSSRYERTTNAHPPSPIDNLYSGISSYRTASHRPLNHRDAPASPTVEPPFPKKKRKRADARSLQVLNEVYNRTAFPSTEEREALAKELDLLPRQVQICKRASRRNRPEEAYKAESSSSTSRRKRPEEAYKAEPSASTRELEQRVEELENRLAEMHREREGGSPFGSQPFEEARQAGSAPQA
ncbi:hypothetical protein FA95DRAFT_610831 [Auriscalpium vulgare]|uniref:Uncharacterized protein n=1 Tax=Auriscalpium vulgare TaxID=40419 RepID=A0ACB8RE96_9AGAM|nr:hypothetical protein FA95DRAFT_610831 [Auriscalpium vulgare]